MDMSDYNRLSRSYWMLLVVLGGLCGLTALYESLFYSRGQWAHFFVLAMLVALSSARPIRLPTSGATFSAGDAFIFLGAIFLGVPAAIILGIIDCLTSTLRASKRASAIIGAPAIMGLTAFLSSSVFYLTLRTYSAVNLYPIGSTPLGFRQLFAPLVLMTIAHYLANTLLVSSVHALKRGASIWAEWRTHQMWFSIHFFAAGFAAAIIYGAITRFGLFYVLLGLPVIAASYAAYYVYLERVGETIREAAERARLHLATVEALATAIDAKDQTTHCHVRRLQIYATGMGRLLKLSDKEIEALQAGSLLHDIGKLAIPAHILNEPGKLTAAEFEKMKMHTIVGAQILERVNFPYPVVPIVRHHHEQWDGNGYPDKLKGEEIPLIARILTVVDCYDSAREDRPFRRGMSRTEAMALLLRGAGTQFEPRLVHLFLQNLPQFEQEITEQKLDTGLSGDECELTPLTKEKSVKGSATSRPSPLLPTAPVPAYLEQIKDAQREVYAFYQIARAFDSSLNLEDTLANLVNKIGQALPFETCVVYLYDEATQTASAAHATGVRADELLSHTIMPGQGLLGTLLAERKSHQCGSPELEFAGQKLPGHNGFRSMAFVSLYKDERLLGALVLYSNSISDYGQDHMRMLDTVAGLASDALANAIHYAEVESNSLTDVLTGLPNSRCMSLHFEQEVARARRTGSPFHVIMLDLDDFKQVNDSFGHRVGDQLLRDVSQIMKAQLREYDFLARYGGDEFVLIVQGLSHNLAEDLCERMEKSVSSYWLEAGADDRQARVGLSAGIAVYGEDGETLDQLLVAADHAMYLVKARHKARREKPDELATSAAG